MKLYAPRYYNTFKCIAHKCKHSCCIGWEIDIDCDTMEKYASYNGEYSQNIIESIDAEGEPHFKLGLGERCPHLDERGLCKIILNVGDGFLCNICSEHPRFYNDTPKGREVGLGIACEEACRIILNSDEYAETLPLEDCDGEVDEELLDTDAYRKMIYSMLSDNCLTYPERLDLIAERYGIVKHSDEECRLITDSLEYLDEEHRNAFLCYSSDTKTPKRYEKILERALAYFIFRHASARENKEDFLAPLGFACFMERLFASLLKSDSDGEKNAITLARIISEEIEYSEDNTEEIMQNFIF